MDNTPNSRIAVWGDRKLKMREALKNGHGSKSRTPSEQPNPHCVLFTCCFFIWQNGRMAVWLKFSTPPSA